MMKYISFFCVTLLLACSTANSSTTERIVVDVDHASEALLTDANRVTTTLLKSKYKKQVGEVKTAVVHAGKIYLLDDRRAKAVFVYDSHNGDELLVIDKLGRGPHEYLSLVNFFVQDEIIYILDVTANKILVYDASGNFKRSMPTEYPAWGLLVDGDDLILDRGTYPLDQSDKALARLDASSGAYKEVFHAVSPELKNLTIMPTHALQKSNGQITYLPSTCCVIYQVDQAQTTPKYELDFGARWPSSDKLTSFARSSQPLQAAIQWSEEGYAGFLNHLDAKNKLIVSFLVEEQPYAVVYDKASKRAKTYQLGDLGRPLFLDDNDNVYFYQQHESGAAWITVNLK